MRIDIISGAGNDEQLDYINKNSDSLIYSSPGFLQLLSKHLLADTYWLVAKNDDGEVVGMMAYLKKEGPLGPVFNSLAYYGSNGGVIQHQLNLEAKIALIAKFYRIARTADAVSATLISNPLMQDTQVYDEHTQYDYKDERIGQITHFPASLQVDELLSLFQNPRPRNIRKAIKLGVNVEKTQSIEALIFLYNTHKKNMDSIGGLPKQSSFFYAIPDMINADNWQIYLATIAGQPIAALLLFYFNQTVEYFTPVILEEHRNSQALALTIYKAMQDAMQLGYKNWNWGGTWLSQGGVYDFKKRWGTSEYRYFYYTQVYNSKLLLSKPEYLLEHYQGFFLIPYRFLSLNN